ncbi:MAG: DUF1622 domain-containing protein [Patescibacteria group bacterium]
MNIFLFAETIGEVLDIAGIFVILIGAIVSTAYFLLGVFESRHKEFIYKSFRNNLARSILLGLEFLVAGDIIRSVTGEPNFTNIAVLGLIVLIRSFLGITFEMEIEGKWPWQKAGKKTTE